MLIIADTDSDLPGPYRLLGAVYGKVGDKAQERQFQAAREAMLSLFR